ncbi:ATP-binding protein, partial [Oleiphilus sp. HI0066]
VREIAHEANNPLSIINNYLSSLSLKLSEEDEVQEELQVLKEELERASQIIFRLRDLQQDITHDEGDADINLEIKNLLTLYKSSLFLAKSIDSEYLPDSSLRPVDISPGSLRQILTNLMKNAVEAMPEGGKISAATKSSINVNGHSFCEIKITDNGPGIPEEIQKNLFTPVSTTKGAGHSGLGLSITKNLVTEARGTITCRSDGKGTQFQILLPEQ